MIEVTADPDAPDDAVAGHNLSVVTDADVAGPGNEGSIYTERPMIPVELLVCHPGNVRQDKQADQAFCRSVATAGIITPLEITVDPGGGYRVVDGNVRLDAALKVGLSAVPYFFSADTADDEGLQYLHMLISSRFRTSLTVHEEAQALFSAAQAGMTRAEIRKATGLSAGEVKAGVRAGGLNYMAKEIAAGMDYEWTLEELALLKPFEDDSEAMEVIRRNRYGPLKYTVQRLLDEREAKARRAKMVAELERAGITVTSERPEGAVLLSRLVDGDQIMDSDAHADCPGRGASLGSWMNASPNHYCLDPVKYGHVFAETGTTSPPEPAIVAPAAQEAKPDTDRKIVVEGNKAWVAAGTVRQQWLHEFLMLKTPPRNVASTIARFITEQLVTMPEPLCRALGGARHSRLFESFGSPTPETVAKSTQPGLWMIALAPIATAYEREITGDGERRNTWREDKYSPCTREDAGAWLRFIADIGAKHGYEPSPIEKAVADGVPYRGDNPAEDLIKEADTDQTSTETAVAGQDPEEHDDQPIDAVEQAPQGTQESEPGPVAEPDASAGPASASGPADAAADPQEVHLAAHVEEEIADLAEQFDAADIYADVSTITELRSGEAVAIT
ncbi:ParB/RepB/Spo0J family partition protein [Sphaerisporangium sp. NPDC051017]|uniref:ParB/RepB/Spo0J family partition protein n=1 Tax=Sphaerisporangium sp. NPDC051017 TaxID=3154636 RepID=UPI003420F229